MKIKGLKQYPKNKKNKKQKTKKASKLQNSLEPGSMSVVDKAICTTIS